MSSVRPPKPSGSRASRCCVLLFSRLPSEEERIKRIPNGAKLFDFARHRVASAVHSVGGTDLIVVEPPGREELAGHLTAPSEGTLSQRGLDFGARLQNAFQDAFSLGYERVIAVPGDVPALSGPHITAAVHAFRDYTSVIGPSPDGGVYLIGLSRSSGVPRLLSALRWQTPHVLRDLTNLLLKNNEDAAYLTPLEDVDERHDLVALALKSPPERLDPLEALLLLLVFTLSCPHRPRPASLQVALMELLHETVFRRGPPLRGLPIGG